MLNSKCSSMIDTTVNTIQKSVHRSVTRSWMNYETPVNGQQQPGSMLLHNIVNCVGIGFDSTWRALALQVAVVVVLGILCIWPMVYPVTLLANIASKEQMALLWTS